VILLSLGPKKVFGFAIACGLVIHDGSYRGKTAALGGGTGGHVSPLVKRMGAQQPARIY
jgi:hypothetical protein